jgi:hypothetical protein
VHIFGGIVSIYLAAVVEVESLGLTAALQPSDVLILVGGGIGITTYYLLILSSCSPVLDRDQLKT